jgi:hypothetical protein
MSEEKSAQKTHPTSTTPPPAEPLTLEDVKVRAERVRDAASLGAKQAVNDIAAQPLARTVAVLAVAVGVGLSMAFYFGSRSGARRAARSASRTSPSPPRR